MIQAIHRAMDIVRIVAAADDGIRLADLALQVKLNKTTAYHLAETLVSEGLLAKNAAVYRIGDLPAKLARGMRQNGAQTKVREALLSLHRKYPSAGIVYSEPGEADIHARYNLPAGIPGRIDASDDMTLNPYLTVAGVLFFAMLPEERLHAIRLRHPFEFKGKEAWGSEKAFNACVALAARRGYSETPGLIGKSEFKIGIPVCEANGSMTAAITFHCQRAAISSAERTRSDIIAAAERIHATDDIRPSDMINAQGAKHVRKKV